MLISLCTPNMGRTHDLRLVMESRIEAGQVSPPVEIVVVNYNSRDGLDEYVAGMEMPEGVILTYRIYRGREHWHMAHGFNLACTAGSGEYFWLLGTDVFMRMDAVHQVRKLIEERGDDLLMARNNLGNIVCRKKLFMEAGGFDERFEFYGQEGLELNERLMRRGAQVGYFSNSLLTILPTARDDKVANYRIKDHMTNMSRMMRPIYEESKIKQPMRANEGKEWGAWN